MATTKKSSKKSKKGVKKVAKLKTFKLYKEQTPFLSFKFTMQTMYWFILLVLIFALSLWVLSIQLKTASILESISSL